MKVLSNTILKHFGIYCKFNRRLNGFNCKVDRSAISAGIQHTKQGVVSSTQYMRTPTQYTRNAQIIHSIHVSRQIHSKQVSVKQKTLCTLLAISRKINECLQRVLRDGHYDASRGHLSSTFSAWNCTVFLRN